MPEESQNSHSGFVPQGSVGVISHASVALLQAAQVPQRNASQEPVEREHLVQFGHVSGLSKHSYEVSLGTQD